MDSATDMGTGRAGNREAILDAAKQVFFDEGYATASMDRIAERAGVTKRTVYAHFASKQALFGAVVERACANVIGQIPDVAQLPAAVRPGLSQMLRTTHALMAGSNCVRLQRIVAAEAERHPQFAATLRAAFDTGEARLKAALDNWTASGGLKPHDTALAARMLNDLVAHATSMRGLIGEPIDQPAARAAVDEAILLYLAAYGA